VASAAKGAWAEVPENEGWPVDLPLIYGYLSPAVGDVLPTRGPEVFVVSGRTMAACSADGEAIPGWPIPLSGNTITAET
jgi:hypothetical protein